MFAAKPILAAVFVAALGYAVSPYIALYRLDRAVRAGDAASLQRLVDWPAVRAGIRQDISASLDGDPARAASRDELPPFGASFVHGIATNAIDRDVTPRGLVAFTRHDRAGGGSHGQAAMQAGAHVDWAFFDNPTDFLVSLDLPGQHQRIRLRMTLRDARWQVTRIWLTQGLLREAKART